MDINKERLCKGNIISLSYLKTQCKSVVKLLQAKKYHVLITISGYIFFLQNSHEKLINVGRLLQKKIFGMEHLPLLLT